MLFKRSKIKFIAAIVFLSFFSVIVFAESVFLKDGKIIECKITQDKKDAIVIQGSTGEIREIQRIDILRVLYTELKMNKIYVQKRDGKGINAYLVAEDRESYIFRTKIKEPKEFTLKRKEVLFIVEKNPTGLELNGSVGSNAIPLKWMPPYDQTRYYNVYVKEQAGDKYELADRSKNKTFELKKLKSNTEYFIQVTSVDNDDYESLPSNELKIKTANAKLVSPKNLTVKKDETGDDAMIAWEKSGESIDNLRQFNIYVTDENESKLIAETKETKYVLKDWRLYHKIEVTAVDQANSESLPVSKRIFDGNSKISFTPGVFLPLGNFGKMAKMGMGGALSFSRQKFFFENFEVGFQAGFYSLPGKNFFDNNSQKVTGIFIIPFYFILDYKIALSSGIGIIPGISLGAAFVNMKYSSWDLGALVYKETASQFIDPSLKGGIAFEYVFSRTYSLKLYGEYGLLMEKGGNLGFLTAGISLGYHY